MTPSRISDEALQEAIEAGEFACARCGHCCKGNGLVRVGVAEVDRAARHLGLTQREFTRQYARRSGAERWILKDKMVPRPPGSNDPGQAPGHGLEQWCTFLERMPDGLYGCAINPVKPDQCASFPRKWRNDDSLQTCVGLRALLARLRQRKMENV